MKMEFVNIELEHYNHKVGINFWHFTWQTKYRYNMFAKFEYKNLCDACIRKASFRHKIKIHILKVMPNHVHVLVTLPKGMNDEIAFQRLKGGSSNSAV
jgi:REP element-mobilizing transposase RayT